MYHYRESGLPHVYLENGYRKLKTGAHTLVLKLRRDRWPTGLRFITPKQGA